MRHCRRRKISYYNKKFYYDSYGGDLIVYCIDDRSSFDKVNSLIIDFKNNAPEDCAL